VAAGYVRDTNEAFATWLGRGRPAFVTREGPSVADTVAVLHQAGGVASLAHPAKTDCDARIPGWRDAGLDALEAFHSDHDAAARQRYVEMAARFRMYITGGSDYHGVPEHGVEPGTATLPREYWEALRDGVRRG
jgi:predicted metal-dependent phosphoesterase TrpH